MFVSPAGQGEGWAPAAYLDQRKTSRSSSRSHDRLHEHWAAATSPGHAEAQSHRHTTLPVVDYSAYFTKRTTQFGRNQSSARFSSHLKTPVNHPISSKYV